MENQYDSVVALFNEAHGRRAKDSDEAIRWARETGLIRDDEFGAFCHAGLVR